MTEIRLKIDYTIFNQVEDEPKVKLTKEMKKKIEKDLDSINKMIEKTTNYYEGMFWMRKYNKINSIITQRNGNN